ncbi:hypothetical protein DERF_011350, partial [Dermatophagoides farinae]
VNILEIESGNRPIGQIKKPVTIATDHHDRQLVLDHKDWIGGHMGLTNCKLLTFFAVYMITCSIMLKMTFDPSFKAKYFVWLPFINCNLSGLRIALDWSAIKGPYTPE